MATPSHEKRRATSPPFNLIQRGVLCLLLLGTVAASALAGDSTYGTIIQVKSVDVVVLDCGKDRYTVRLVGIDAPTDPGLAKQGKLLLTDLVLKKRVQMRFEFRNDKLEMVARILTLQTEKADVKDAGEVLVRAGLARRQEDYDYKCGCLVKAETEAKEFKRGIWASN